MKSNTNIHDIAEEIAEVRLIIQEVKAGLQRNDATHVNIIRDVKRIKKDNESSFNDARSHVFNHWRWSITASAIGLMVLVYRLYHSYYIATH